MKVNKIRYEVKQSKEPEGEKTHIVIYYKESDRGFGSGRIFKGTKKECEEFAKEKNSLTQRYQVLKYLVENRTITSYECFQHLRICDLQKAIQLLKEQGYPISDEWVQNGKKKFKRYKLEV